MIQKEKIEYLTTVDQVMVYYGHWVQYGVCDPLGQIALKFIVYFPKYLHIEIWEHL